MKPSFFGETVYAPSRRIDDEFEECETLKPKKKYISELSINPECMVITTDKLSHAFSNVYLIDSEEIAGRIFEVDEDESQKIEKCRIYRTLNKSTVVCQAFGADPASLNTFAMKIVEMVPGVRQVVILKSEHISTYKTLNPSDEMAISRSLKTSECTIDINVPLLEEPNIATGISAAILSRCELKSVPAFMLLAFTDSFSPDSISISGFLPILNYSKITSVSENEVQERLRKLADRVQTDQIYM